MRRRIMVGLAVMAAAVDVAGAAAPAATTLPPTPGAPPPAVPPIRAMPRAADAPLGQSGWLIATGAFALLGLGMRSRRTTDAHAIG